MKTDRIYSAHDLYYNILYLILFSVLSCSLLFVPKEAFYRVLLLAVLTAGLMLWFYIGTYYELREDCLLCRTGPICYKIFYCNIKSLQLKNNLLSSAAMSRKRIEIKEYGKSYITGTTLISPENREDFLQQLMTRCKNLEIDEQGAKNNV